MRLHGLLHASLIKRPCVNGRRRIVPTDLLKLCPHEFPPVDARILGVDDFAEARLKQAKTEITSGSEFCNEVHHRQTLARCHIFKAFDRQLPHELKNVVIRGRQLEHIDP